MCNRRFLLYKIKLTTVTEVGVGGVIVLSFGLKSSDHSEQSFVPC